MSDIEDTVATDGVGDDVLTPSTTETPAPAVEAAAETKVEEPKEKTLAEKIEDLAAAKSAKEKTDEPAKVAAETKPDAHPAYEPNYKFKVLSKEFEIPKEFQSLVKDKDSEKMVKDVFEKAFGIDTIKEKATQTRAERDQFANENAEIKSSIDGMRAIYKEAVASNNFLKLDDFFARLNIPEQHIMQYVLAKVQFSNLPPEQQQMIRGQMEADKSAAVASQQVEQLSAREQTMGQRLRGLELNVELAKPETQSIAVAFDAQAGKPGAFRDQVAAMGELAWYREQVDLTPEQAIQRVVATFGLKAPTAPLVAAATAPAAPVPPEKKVIMREASTIPNIQGRSSSPLKKGPRSIADLEKLRDEALARAD